MPPGKTNPRHLLPAAARPGGRRRPVRSQLRRKQARGIRSRSAILHAAAELATVSGLHGLSIGDLAAHLGISKSGLYAHFKSKEELELATIRTAAEIFQREVLTPGTAAAPGAARLVALADAFLDHVRRRVFPGGCFFAAVAAEVDTRPGAARDLIAKIQGEWMALLAQCLREARSRGQIRRSADVEQLAFEAQAMLLAANFLFVLRGDVLTLKRARCGIDRLLRASGG